MRRTSEQGLKACSDKCRCPSCVKDDMVIKDGMCESKSGLQQRFYCKRCSRGFTARTGFEGMHGQAVAILLSLNLYYRGLSLRQIARTPAVRVQHNSKPWSNLCVDKEAVKIISEYAKAVGEAFKGGDPLIHVQTGIATSLSNNEMERFFRTLKQRYKVISNFYSSENAETFMDGFRAYYNFIRGIEVWTGYPSAGRRDR